MGLWSDLFRHAGAGSEALLSPGRSYTQQPFPALGITFDVTTGAPMPLHTLLGDNKPAIVLLYSNC